MQEVAASVYYEMLANQGQDCEQSTRRNFTLLLSSMSALLPTNILLTLSDACCSMFFIQFLMSGATICVSSHKQILKVIVGNIVPDTKKRQRHTVER